MHTAFLCHGLPLGLRAGHRPWHQVGSIRMSAEPVANEGRVRLSTRGRLFAATGAISLSLALLNRLVLTPEQVSPFQARADILGVVCGVSLLLYGAGSGEVSERGTAVELQGIELEFESVLDQNATAEAGFIAGAALKCVPNFVSAAFFYDGACVARQGLFRADVHITDVSVGDVVRGAVHNGQIAYLADLRVVPTKEIEFPYLPRECQAVVVVPFGKGGAILFGADKVRPLLGSDFGWLAALGDRLGAAIDSAS